MTYFEKLRDPRWQKKRLEIMQRDYFMCMECGSSDKTLCVHHRYYISNREPWEYPDFCFLTLCQDCHFQIKENDELDRNSAGIVFDGWEIGIDHFGEDIEWLAYQHKHGEIKIEYISGEQG